MDKLVRRLATFYSELATLEEAARQRRERRHTDARRIIDETVAPAFDNLRKAFSVNGRAPKVDLDVSDPDAPSARLTINCIVRGPDGFTDQEEPEFIYTSTVESRPGYLKVKRDVWPESKVNRPSREVLDNLAEMGAAITFTTPGQVTPETIIDDVLAEYTAYMKSRIED